MLNGGETVLVGLSGGADSVCLLHLLDDLKENLSLTIHAVYVDHNLRPDETPGEIEFCRNLCKKMGVNFIQKSVDIESRVKERGINKQEAARELRYKIFSETALEVRADKIALAHNADDQAETLFMRLVRGTGPAGLTGIPVKRDNVIRPLIEIERREIETFLSERKIEFIIDSSNLRKNYFRNMLRLSFLPELKKINPNLINSVTRTVSILQEEERYFDIIIAKSLMKLISRKTDKRIELFLSPLEGMNTVLLRRILRRAIDETENLRGVSFINIEDIIALIKNGKSGDRIYLPRGLRIIKEYSLLVMTSEEPQKLSAHELQPPGELVIRGSGIVLKAEFEKDASDLGDGKKTVLLDADSMNFPLTVRPRSPGDYFFPLGFGKKKKLQDFFVDEKVPRDERDSIPLVVSGTDIVWIAGFRADHRFRVTEDTKNFLRLGILKGRF
jgi:tRNA(Ile)-lysidine synthase